jgi:predicted nucleic acid-binding protein
MTAAFLVDTNVLVYRHDPRSPAKQTRSAALLRDGLTSGNARIPHQAIVEFVAATTRPLRPVGVPLLSPEESRREIEEIVNLFPILYPTEQLVRLALRGAAAYQLSWFDAHLWAYAEHYGLPQLYSEDFQHGRSYGSVRVVDPFQDDG